MLITICRSSNKQDRCGSQILHLKQPRPLRTWTERACLLSCSPTGGAFREEWKVRLPFRSVKIWAHTLVWEGSLLCRHVRPGAEVWGLHRGWAEGVQAACAGLYPAAGGAQRRLLGGHWSHHQPPSHGDVRRQGQQVGCIQSRLVSHLYLPVLLTSTVGVCRGGVLEPEGTVEIKFRRKDLVKTMRRVDPIYTSLAERLGEFCLDDFSPVHPPFSLLFWGKKIIYAMCAGFSSSL